MNRDEILEAVRTVLSEQMAHPHMQGFAPEARLNEDLYLDSVLILQILNRLHGQLVACDAGRGDRPTRTRHDGRFCRAL
jgi:hypothetical protein